MAWIASSDSSITIRLRSPSVTEPISSAGIASAMSVSMAEAESVPVWFFST